MGSSKSVSTTRFPGDASTIKTIALLLILATPAVQATEDVKSPDLAAMHVQELKRLERLFRENEVVQVGTELKKDDPNYARAQEFCKAQVQALKANDPSLTIPKPFIIFQGQNAAQKMEDFVIDPSIPDATYGQRCWRSHPIVLNGKTIDYDKEFEFYKYPGSVQYGTVIFSRTIEKKEGAVGSTGFFSYSPVRKKCVGSRGGGTGIYSWHGEDIFYTSTELGEWLAGETGYYRPETWPRLFRVLLYQPQYNDTPRHWQGDPSVGEFTVDYPKDTDAYTYQCRIEIKMTIPPA